MSSDHQSSHGQRAVQPQHALIDRIIRQFFASTLREADPDDAVIEYVQTVLTDVDLVRAPDLLGVGDMLAGFSDKFAAMQEERQNELTWQIISEVQNLLVTGSATCPSAYDGPCHEESQIYQHAAAQPVVDVGGLSLAALRLQRGDSLLNAPHVRLNGFGTSRGPASSTVDRPGRTPAEQAHAPLAREAEHASTCGAKSRTPVSAADRGALGTLQELSGGSLSEGFLAYLLQLRCVGDLDAAIDWILECEDIDREHGRWCAAQEQERLERAREEKEERHSRKKVLERYDLEPVDDGTAARANQANVISAWAAPADNRSARDRHAKVRYRDGIPATSRGEKYVVVSNEHDYDGGSKGKVITKGKRGKGFV